MTSQLLVLLLVCSVLLNPVLGVGHLFVDEITGYTNEDVSATNVHTGLLVVDEQTVTNGVTATGGSNSHVVDTSGKIFFNAGVLDFSANESFEITSLGESVGFEANDLTFSSDHDISFDAVDISFVASDIIGTVGGTFGTYGTDAELRTVFDLTLSAENNFFLDSAERVRLKSNEFSVQGDSISVASAESNLFVESLLHLSLNADNEAKFTADSGLEVGSSHGDANLSATNDMSVLAENFIYTTETNTFSIADTFTFETQSIAGDIFMYTERTYIDVPEGTMRMESTGTNAQTAVLTSGTIEGTSDTFSASGADILLVSVDATTFTSRTDLSMDAVNDVLFLASGGMTYEGSNVLLESTTGDIIASAFGKSFFTAVSADLLINAGTDFTFTTGATSISAENSMEINSNELNVNGDFVDFYSARDIIVNGPSLVVSASLGAAFDSHENSVFRAEDIRFFSETVGTVTSSGNIIFQSDDFFSSADNDIEYISIREAVFSSVDTILTTGSIPISAIFFDSEGFAHFSSGGASNFNLSDELIAISIDYDISANNNINYQVEDDITFLMQFSAGTASFESFNVDMDTEESFSITAGGNTVFTSDSIAVSAGQFQALGSNVVLSAVDGANFVGDGSGDLLWEATSTFIYLPTELSASAAVDITGSAGIHFGSSINHGDTLSFVAPDLTDSHNAVSLAGGYVDFSIAGITTFGVENPDSPIINFAVDGEKDFKLSVSDGSMAFDIERNFELNGSHLSITAGELVRLQADDISFVVDEFSIRASDDIDFVLNNADVFDFSFVSSMIHSDGAIVVSGINAGNFFSEILIDIGSRDLVEFNTFSFNAVTRDFHIYANEWFAQSLDDISITSNDALEFFFDLVHFSSTGNQMNVSGTDLESVAKVSSSIVGGSIDIDAVDLEVDGGSITLTTEAFNLVTDLFLVGNTGSTPANLNLENTVLDFDSDFTITAPAEFVSIIATGSEAFEHEGIRMVATELNVDAAFLSVEAFKGVVVNTPVFTSTSADNTEFTATLGSMTSYARVGDISYTATTSNINFDSSAGITIQAYSSISSNSAISTITAAKEINMLSQENSIEFEATTLLLLTGEAFTLTAGLDEEISSDILFSVGGDAIFNFASFARIQAHGDQSPGQSNEQVSISGGDTLGRISGVDQVSFYPSGSFSLDVDLDSIFAATTGDLSFGSESNLFNFNSRTGSMFFTSAGDYSVNAGGVFGNIIVDVANDFTLTVTGGISSSANGTVALFSDFYTVGALDDITYLTENDQSKIYTSVGSVNYNTLLDNIDIIGRNSKVVSFGSTLAVATAINLGAGTPRISSNATDVNWTAIGDININSPSDLIRYHSDSLSGLSTENAIMKSGFDFIVESNVLLTIESESIDMAAGNSVVISTGNGLISHDPITLSSTGTASGNGMVITSSQNTGSTQFIGDNGIVHTIADGYTMNSLSGSGFLSQFTTTTNTLTMASDFELTMEGETGMNVLTTGNTAKVAFLTEGHNSDIVMSSLDTTTLTSASNINILADGAIDQTISTGDAVFSATGGNAGKINLDASGDITMGTIFSDVVANVDGDVDFSATGEDSLLHLNSENISLNTPNGGVSFGTDAAEGGSITIESDTGDSNVSFSANTWLADIDGSFNVDTLGSFTFFSDSGDFDLAAFGYAVMGTLEDFSIFSTSGGGDILFEAENAYIHAVGVDVVATSQGTFTANSDSINVIINGNDTNSNTDDHLGFTSLGDMLFSELNGNTMISTYAALTVEADSGYIQIEGSATSGNAISVTTTYPGGDFSVNSDSAFIFADDINMVATGTAPESGFVKIVAARDAVYDPTFWNGAFSPPIVVISSAQETSIKSETGDIVFEYSSQLLIDGGDVNAFIGGAMEVNIRGDGRAITTTVDNNLVSPAAISMHDVSGVQFITENGGHVIFESGAADIRVNSAVSTLRADTGDLYLESSGVVSFIGHRDELVVFYNNNNNNEIEGGVDLLSTGGVFIDAYDTGMIMASSNAFFANPNINGAVNWIVEENSLLEIYSERDIDFAPADDLFVSNSNLGDINLIVSTPSSGGRIRIEVDDNARFQSGNDIYISYEESLTMVANRISFVTNFLGDQVDFPETFSDASNYVRLDGFNRISDAGDVYAESQSRPIVAFPSIVRFNNNGATNIHVSQGSWCEVNRQIGFGESNQGGVYNYGFDLTDDVFCVCIDHVWACIYDAPTSNYYYDPYNVNR